MDCPAPLLRVLPHISQLEEYLLQSRSVRTAVHLSSARGRRVSLRVLQNRLCSKLLFVEGIWHEIPFLVTFLNLVLMNRHIPFNSLYNYCTCEACTAERRAPIVAPQESGSLSLNISNTPFTASTDLAYDSCVL